MKLAEAAVLVVARIEETLFYYVSTRALALFTDQQSARTHTAGSAAKTRADRAFPDGKSALMLAAAGLRYVAGTK